MDEPTRDLEKENRYLESLLEHVGVHTGDILGLQLKEKARIKKLTKTNVCPYV